MMAYVKLDCGILNSTLWVEKPCRDIFITALLLARPKEFSEPVPQLEVSGSGETGFVAPPGWYGMVDAAGPGIVSRAGLDMELGLTALRRLGEPDPESRTPDFEGRRMIRISGGYLILNYDAYREKDHTAADRVRRFRDKQRAARNGVALQSNAVQTPSVTEAVSSKQEAVKPKLHPPSQLEPPGCGQPAAGLVPADAVKATPNPVPGGFKHVAASLEDLRVGLPQGSDEHERAGELWSVMAANGVKGTASHPVVIELVRDGVTAKDVRAAIVEARKSNDGPLNPAYLAPIIERLRSGKGKDPETAAWATDERATEAKARELGLWPAKGGESWDELRGRIRAKIAQRAGEGVR